MPNIFLNRSTTEKLFRLTLPYVYLTYHMLHKCTVVENCLKLEILTRGGLLGCLRPRIFSGPGEPTKTGRAGLDLTQPITKEKIAA